MRGWGTAAARDSLKGRSMMDEPHLWRPAHCKHVAYGTYLSTERTRIFENIRLLSRALLKGGRAERQEALKQCSNFRKVGGASVDRRVSEKCI